MWKLFFKIHLEYPCEWYSRIPPCVGRPEPMSWHVRKRCKKFLELDHDGGSKFMYRRCPGFSGRVVVTSRKTICYQSGSFSLFIILFKENHIESMKTNSERLCMMLAKGTRGRGRGRTQSWKKLVCISVKKKEKKLKRKLFVVVCSRPLDWNPGDVKWMV